MGIAVLTGAEVELTNCAILNCNTAILQDSAATLHLGNTQVIRSCGVEKVMFIIKGGELKCF